VNQFLPHHELRQPSDSQTGHTVMLGHALGCDLRMWGALATHLLAQGHRVLRYDQRGHGGSSTPPGPYSMADLADDAARLIDSLDVGPVIWIGLSMGGMVGQELVLRDPAHVKALVLANTTSSYPPEAQAGWAQRIAGIQQGGLEAIVDGALQRWFHESFRAAHPEVVALWRSRVLACRQAGYIACCEAISQVNTTERLHAIRQPTLVIAGALDVGTPPAFAEVIAARIPGAQLTVLPEASHLSVLEQPQAFMACVDGWLARLPAL
jgi:3-oxoadipate enol-lactonase